MPSEKVLGILRSRSSMGEDELTALSEAAAWRLVYQLPTKPATPKRLSVCFTGFASTEKTELMELAIQANHHVASGVTKTLGLLICGAAAGPAKLEKAASQGVALMTGGGEYRELLRVDSGERDA